MEPHVHRSPSDFRYRVHDGEQFVAVYEPHEEHIAQDHLQRLLAGRRRKRTATPVPPREYTLELDAVPVSGRAATAQAEDVDTVHVKQFRDGWRVWNPGVQAYVTGPGFTPYASKTAAMERARDIMVEMKGKAKRAARGDVAVAPGVSSGTLFSPAEMTAKGGQMGFKFNGMRSHAFGKAERDAWFATQHPASYPDGRVIPVLHDDVVRRHADGHYEVGRVAEHWDGSLVVRFQQEQRGGHARNVEAVLSPEWTVSRYGDRLTLAQVERLTRDAPVAPRRDVRPREEPRRPSAPSKPPLPSHQLGFKFNGRKRNRALDVRDATAQETDWTRRMLAGRYVRLVPKRARGEMLEGFVAEVGHTVAGGFTVKLEGRAPVKLAEYAVDVDAKRNGAHLPWGRRGSLAAPPPMPPYDESPIGRAVTRDDLTQRRRRAVEEYEAMESLRVEHF